MQGRDRPRAAHAVGSQAGEPLEALQRAGCARAEMAVEWAGGKAVPGEEELELRDVPPERAHGELPAAERVPPVAAERDPRSRAGNAVRRQAHASLEGANR